MKVSDSDRKEHSVAFTITKKGLTKKVTISNIGQMTPTQAKEKANAALNANGILAITTTTNTGILNTKMDETKIKVELKAALAALPTYISATISSIVTSTDGSVSFTAVLNYGPNLNTAVKTFTITGLMTQAKLATNQINAVKAAMGVTKTTSKTGVTPSTISSATPTKTDLGIDEPTLNGVTIAYAKISSDNNAGTITVTATFTKSTGTQTTSTIVISGFQKAFNATTYKTDHPQAPKTSATSATTTIETTIATAKTAQDKAETDYTKAQTEIAIKAAIDAMVQANIAMVEANKLQEALNNPAFNAAAYKITNKLADATQKVDKVLGKELEPTIATAERAQNTAKTAYTSAQTEVAIKAAIDAMVQANKDMDAANEKQKTKNAVVAVVVFDADDYRKKHSYETILTPIAKAQNKELEPTMLAATNLQTAAKNKYNSATLQTEIDQAILDMIAANAKVKTANALQTTKNNVADAPSEAEVVAQLTPQMVLEAVKKVLTPAAGDAPTLVAFTTQSVDIILKKTNGAGATLSTETSVTVTVSFTAKSIDTKLGSVTATYTTNHNAPAGSITLSG